MERRDGNNNRNAKGNDDGDDDDDEESIEEELGYLSPLDSVDSYRRFKQALGSKFFLSQVFSDELFPDFFFAYMIIIIDFEVANPQMYQMATTSLDIEQQTQLMEIIRQAEKNAMVG